nr:ribonuclease H-like domain-containing protein [Tanacetum cinerariifolium]
MASRDQQWYMDTGATSHLSSHTGNLQTTSLNRNFHSIIVGNRSSIPVTHSGHVQIPNPYSPLHLRNVLVTPNIIKNFVSVRKFTTDNKCSIDSDPYGFTVRDYHTRQTLLRCDSTGDLYPLHVAASAFALLTNNHSLWHQRLGHPGDDVIHTLSSHDNLDTSPIALCLLTTPTSPQQTTPQTTPQINPHTTPQSTPPTHLSTPSRQTTPTPPTTSPPPPPTSQHPMITRSKVEIMKANPIYNFHVTTSSPILKSSFHALRDPNWKQAMCDEYEALIDNNTWILVPRPLNTKYATEIHEQAQMLNSNPCRTPIDTEKKLGPEGSPVTDPTLYCNLAESLQYLTFTRPNLSYAVQQLCLYMHDPWELHLNVMKRVLHCPATRRSTSRYCVFLGDNLLTWSSKHQDTLSCSNVEAEYHGVANVIVETSWICNLLRELYTPLFTATLVYCDNVSVVYMSVNLIQHPHTKHIKIDIHFLRDKVAAGHVRVLHVPSRFQYAYILTKGLPYPLFADFRSSLRVRKTPAPTAEAHVAGSNGKRRHHLITSHFPMCGKIHVVVVSESVVKKQKGSEDGLWLTRHFCHIVYGYELGLTWVVFVMQQKELTEFKCEARLKGSPIRMTILAMLSTPVM